MRFYPLLLAVGSLLPALGASAAPAAESCGVIAGTPPELVAVPALHVLSLTSSSEFTLPTGVPDNVSAVVCARVSLVPVGNDYKVLLAGFPLGLKDKAGNILWLELRNGQLAADYKKTALSQSQVLQLQQWLNQVQATMQAPAVSASST